MSRFYFVVVCCLLVVVVVVVLLLVMIFVYDVAFIFLLCPFVGVVVFDDDNVITIISMTSEYHYQY